MVAESDCKHYLVAYTVGRVAVLQQRPDAAYINRLYLHPSVGVDLKLTGGFKWMPKKKR